MSYLIVLPYSESPYLAKRKIFECHIQETLKNKMGGTPVFIRNNSIKIHPQFSLSDERWRIAELLLYQPDTRVYINKDVNYNSPRNYAIVSRKKIYHDVILIVNIKAFKKIANELSMRMLDIDPYDNYMDDEELELNGYDVLHSGQIYMAKISEEESQICLEQKCINCKLIITSEIPVCEECMWNNIGD